MRCLETGLRWTWTMHFISVAEGMVDSYRDAEDFEGFKLAVIVNFGVDTAITEEEFLKEATANS